MPTNNKIVQKEYDKLVEKMTPKQAKFLNLWLKTGNGTRSAMEAYDTKDPNTAGAIANENLRKLKNPMKLFLENNGIGLSHLVKIAMDASQAEKTDITGDVHPDHRVRMEAGDRLAKWLEVEPKEETLQQTNIQINLTRGEDDTD